MSTRTDLSRSTSRVLSCHPGPSRPSAMVGGGHAARRPAGAKCAHQKTAVALPAPATVGKKGWWSMLAEPGAICLIAKFWRT
jgi:hypothetical protein